MSEDVKVSRKTLEAIRELLINRSAGLATRKANFERATMVAAIGELLGESGYSPDWANVLQLKDMSTERLAKAIIENAATVKELADIFDAWLTVNRPPPEPNLF